MFIYYNPNPESRDVGDCVIRALSAVMSMTWDEAYDELSRLVHEMHDMPSSNSVWGEYLRRYSRDGSTMEKLNHMMDDASSDVERDVIRRIMDNL